jgi:glycosyltransferase involved in cell wall biosynthesis
MKRRDDDERPYVSVNVLKIAAHIGVKDEVELIEGCLNHLESIGVTRFIVSDTHSTDGTAEILERRRSDNFKVVKFSVAEVGSEWLRVNELAVRDIDCDWILFLDADEFPLPRTGSLHDALAGAATDLVRLPRYNVVPTFLGPRMPDAPTRDRYEEIDLIVKPVPNIRQHLAENSGAPWIRTVPIPKIAVRPQFIGELTHGGHDIVPRDGPNITRADSSDIVIAHVALSSPQRFRRKIENIREFFKYQDSYFGPDIAWHWRRWLELANQGTIDREFENSLFEPEKIAELRREGVIASAAAMLQLAHGS